MTRGWSLRKPDGRELQSDMPKNRAKKSAGALPELRRGKGGTSASLRIRWSLPLTLFPRSISLTGLSDLFLSSPQTPLTRAPSLAIKGNWEARMASAIASLLAGLTPTHRSRGPVCILLFAEGGCIWEGFWGKPLGKCKGL